MKISVIVPVYNRLEHLRALFICLLNQKINPYELIITDDGSSEKVEEYINDLIPKAKFKIKHIYQEDKGFRKTRALNNGVRNSEGDILVFCDQDLIFSEDYLEKIKNSMTDKNFIMGRPCSMSEEEKIRTLKILEKEYSYKEIEDLMPREYLESVKETLKKDKLRRIMNKIKLNKRGIRLVGMSYALTKENYIKVNGYDERYQGWGYEDDDFGNRLGVKGIKGKELITDYIQLHLYHYFDPTKKHSLNEDYYYKRKEEIFKNKDYYCKYGYDNMLDKDKVKINIL
ncbi:MAG: glycosyltransferase [Fusobacterium sp. JB019]|nr:glycosyltransferase [Fusobacterium sp. JB019]